MRKRAAVLSLLGFLLLAPSELDAADRRVVTAARTSTPPVIDGRVNEEVWALAPAITGLRQQRPDNGQPASEEIEVHVLYDDSAIYVGAVMQHKNSKVVRLLARRDTFLESEWFGIMIDSQRDRRSALGFFVNPDGVQLDEAVTDDIVEDYDWDSVWQSAATIGEGGWSAELRIPLSLLRFSDAQEQLWGVQFIRWIRGRNEQARLTSHPRDEKGFVSRFGDLAGIDGIRRRPHLELQPYGTSEAARSEAVVAPDPFDQRSSTESDAGLDLRWSGRGNVSVNATFNPDFGQVEVDPAVVNLSEFELFLPEKRPFFVEGAKLFNFGGTASAYTSPYRIAHPLMFYSRRIGREPAGTVAGEFIDLPSETRILGAGKLIARSGSTTFSAIDALTDEAMGRGWQAGKVQEALVQPRSNYFAGRMLHEFGEQTRIGALATSVLRDTETSFLVERASALGFDGQSWFSNQTLLLDWIVAASEMSGSPLSIAAIQQAPAHAYQRPDSDALEFDPTRTSLSGWGAKAVLSRESGTWRYQFGAQNYSPGFDLNEAGFHSRSDLLGTHAQLTWFDVVKRKHTRNNRITAGPYFSWNSDGDALTRGFTTQYANTFINWWTTNVVLSYGLDAIDDRETRGGPAIAKPAGWSSQIRVTSNTSKKAWIDIGRNDGGDEDGSELALTSLTVGFRPRTNITLQLSAALADNRYAARFFRSVGDPLAPTYGRRYLFGRLHEERLEFAPRIDWTITRTLTLQLYMQPLAASGTYTEIGELERSHGSYAPYAEIAATDNGYVADPDGGGPAAPFAFVNPDFTVRSLRANAVLRWEVGPATLFAVWNQGRDRRELDTSSGVSGDLRAIDELPADDRFLLKVSYRFEFPR